MELLSFVDSSHRHATILAVLVASALSLVPIVNDTPVEDRTLAVRAPHAGAPHVVLDDGYYERARIANDRLPNNYAAPARVEALGLATADFDGDGIKDIAATYAAPGGGLVALRRGNVDAFLPPRQAYRDIRSPLESVNAFEEEIVLYDVALTPEFVATGDFDADGYPDLVAGSRSDDRLELLIGDGLGGFRRVHRFMSLPGKPTALVAGDVNRRDGLADLAVAVSRAQGPALLVFEATRGAANAVPEAIPLEDPARDIAIANLGDGYPIDLVVAAGAAISVVRGRDRRTYLPAEAPDRTPSVTMIDVGAPVSSVAVGRFVGSTSRDIAVLTTDGSLLVLDGETKSLLRTPYSFVSAAKHQGGLRATQTSALLGDDLIVRDPDNRQLFLLHAKHFAQMAPEHGRADQTDVIALPEPVLPALVLRSTHRPAAIDTRRVNGDGLHDLIVLAETDEPFVADLSTTLTAPAAIWVVNDSGTDADDDFSDGLCLTVSGTCTLRAAIEELNRVEGSHEIRFTVGHVDATVSDRHGTMTRATFVNGNVLSRVDLRSTYGDMRFASFTPEGSVVRGMSVNALVGYEGTVVEGNHIGVSHSGEAARASSSGLNLFGSGGSVGGRLRELRNVVLRMQLGPEAVVEGNYVGLDATGSIGLFQNAEGIRSSGIAENITIGGVEPGAGNVISGHGAGTSLQNAIHLGGDGLVVQGNLIGTDATGTVAIPNSHDGIQTSGEALIGGTVPGARNVIAASGQHGITLSGEGNMSVVKGNYIGTDITGKVAMGNILSGVHTSRTSATIGGADGPNVISGNGRDGIDMGLDSQGGPYFIHNNFIGTDVSGLQPVPNGEFGIDASAENGIEIGGSPALANVIAFNGKAGVAAFRRGIAIRANSIFGNAELGITQRGTANPAQNDTQGDPADDLSDDQNYPVLSVVGDNSVEVVLDSRGSETFAIDIYGNASCDASGHGEGHVFLDSFEMTTDVTGHASATRAVAINASTNVLAATATAADNTTSEFSACVTLEVATIQVRALQDETSPRPLSNMTFSYGRFDGPDAESDGNFEIIGTVVSDSEGIVKLDGSELSPGDAFFLRAEHHTKAVQRGGHDEVDNTLYTVHVDNLSMDATGTHMVAPMLALDPNETTDTFVERATVGFNLVVSIEWDPSDTYADGLIAAFRNVSNLMLDVTDGHAFLQTVAFFANGERWDEADVRFYANNTTWPSADRAGSDAADGHVRFPPAHFGSARLNVTLNTLRYPLDPNVHSNFATVTHELGHYLFGLYDEYLDASGRELPDVENWSIMDRQLERNARASELAWLESPGYRLTRQWMRSGERSGWTAFSERYATRDGSFDALIGEPGADRPGPNADLGSPDFNAGATMAVADHMARRSGDAVVMQVNLGGSPASDADVSVVKSTRREINQGRTHSSADPDLDGAIVLRGADAGDRVLVALRRGHLEWFSADERVPANTQVPASTAAAHSKVVTEAQADFVVELNRLDGAFVMLPTLTFAGPDAMTIDIETAGLPSALAATVTDAAGAAVGTDVSHPIDMTTIGVTSATVSRSPFTVMLEGTDASANAYVVPGRLEVLAAASVPGEPDKRRVAGDALQFEIEMPSGATVDRVAAFGFDFPASRDGIPDSVVRVTPVLALAGHPESAVLTGDLTLYWGAGDLVATADEAVRVYSWDGLSWSALPSRAVRDSANQTVSAEIPGAGTYAAYLDLTLAGHVGVDDGAGSGRAGGDGDRAIGVRAVSALHNYPAPFTESTTISFELGAAGRVTLDVFDLLGRKVVTLIDEQITDGQTRIQVDTRAWPAGVYFARLRAAGDDVVLSMVKAQ